MKKKRITIAIVLLSILLVVCVLTAAFLLQRNKANEIDEIKPIKFYETVRNKFNYEEGKSLINGLYVEYKDFNRGDEVKIVDEDGEFYYINSDDLILAISKEFIRTEKEQPFIKYNGYTRKNCKMYSDYELSNLISNFALNEKVEVIDKITDLLLIKYDGTIGYVKDDEISTSIIRVHSAQKEENAVAQEKDEPSSSIDPMPSPSPTPVPESTDGEDIHLWLHNNRVVSLSSDGTYAGKILANNTHAYITKYQRNEEVQIFGENEKCYYLLVGGRIGTVDKKFVRKNSEMDYLSWAAYSKKNRFVYDDFARKNSIELLKINAEITILDEIDNIYIIETTNGLTGYMLKEDVSKTKIVKEINTKINAEEYIEPSKAEPSESPEQHQEKVTEPEWTEPVL